MSDERVMKVFAQAMTTFDQPPFQPRQRPRDFSRVLQRTGSKPEINFASRQRRLNVAARFNRR
jgi:hypothetical protein